MGEAVDTLIGRIMRESNLSKESAIRILKSKGVIKQEGEQLVMAKEKRDLGS